MFANTGADGAKPHLLNPPMDADPGLVRIEDEVGRFDTSYITLLVGLRWAILLAFLGLGVTNLVPMHPVALSGTLLWIAFTNVVATWVWLQKRRVPWYDDTYLFADIISVTCGVLASANLEYPIWAAYLMVMATGAAELSTRLSILNAIGCTFAYIFCAAVISLAGWSDPSLATLIVTALIMGFIGFNLTVTFDGSRRIRSYIRKISVTDPLTGLANRRILSDALGAHLDADSPIAVIVLDVDNFKDYNDSRGHLAGDQLLVRLAAALNHEFPDADIISRYGGDEFVILIRIESADHASNRIQRIIEGGPYDPMPISVGIALWPINEATLDSALAAADDCLRIAKTTNKGGIVAFSESGRQHATHTASPQPHAS